MEISKFFKEDYVNTASYDNLRKIASCIDGQKNANRKIIHTIIQKNIKEKIKVSQLNSKVAEFTEYLHASMDAVISGMAQDFAGTNNIPLLVKKGNFGTRFTPEASASRYIYCYGSDFLFKNINKHDSLVKQYFEGVEIEPVYFLPTLPLLLINGSDGVSFGFAQKIMSRNPALIKKKIKDVLKSGKPVSEGSSDWTVPYIEGFKGKIEQDATVPNKFIISGTFERLKKNQIRITEIPFSYNLRSYLNVLDKLEDSKIIADYKDKSANDNFEFIVDIKDLNKKSDEEILTMLKLTTSISENYTCFDENNKIKVFNNVEEILQHFIDFKLSTLSVRRENLLNVLNEKIDFAYSKQRFIELIINDELQINKKSRDYIVKELKKYPEIQERDNYEYLLKLPISSLTKEQIEKLKEQQKENKKALDELSAKTNADIWNDDLALL